MTEHDGHIDSGPEEWRELDYAAIGSAGPGIPDKRQVRQWALVLDSRTIPCLFDVYEGRWRLLVPADRHDAAVVELVAYCRSNSDWPPPAVTGYRQVENTLSTLSVLILLAIFHNITLLELPGMPDWNAIGAADATAIRGGEWWRTLTALMLHADWGHLSSNLVIGGVFAIILCRQLGSGLAWCLTLGAGALGNLVNSLFQQGGHVSIGASTAVFGIVGILAAFGLVRRRFQLQRRWPLPMAGAVALLALLGTEGKHTDLGAHLFGCAAGVVLGLAAAYTVERRGQPDALQNLLLVLLAGTAVAGAWWMAVLAG